MLISCKCLNFIATSSSSQQHSSKGNGSNATAAVASSASAGAASATSSGPAVANGNGFLPEDDCSMSSTNGNDVSCAGSNTNVAQVANALMHVFLQRFPRNFLFYSQCMEFFKQAIGPIPDFTINAVNQKDLIYSITLEVPQAQGTQSWQISICINCNTVLCAKRLQPASSPSSPNGPSPPQYLVNCSLLTTNDELTQRRAEKSFSETFGIIIIDHPTLMTQNSYTATPTPTTNASNNGVHFTIGSMSSLSLSMPTDSKQQRVKQLQQNLQQRLKLEIAETDERIQRYTEQQFALLKSFREKSEQEYNLLTRVIQRVPDQQAIEWLDRMPPVLDVNNGVSYVARRRNTITSRRDLKSNAPTTPTSTNAASTTSITSSNSAIDGRMAATATSNSTQTQTVLGVTAPQNYGNRKMSNFDTPPATPEATPMSVGNSPTFRQQQPQQAQQPPTNFRGFIGSSSFQQQYPTPTVESADDCLFELEGVDSINNAPTSFAPVSAFNLNSMQQQQYALQQQQQYQRSFNNHLHQESNMSDYESDGAEEAEDALDLETSMPIPMDEGARRQTAAQMMNFAKSLPIEIANSPMALRNNYIVESDEDELDNTIDIAASIKALAKSVHGEAVFGDLPRPRLRSQI